MFTAWLLICALSNQESWSWYPVQDMRGPYYNRDQCLERIDEMVTDIENTFDLSGQRYKTKCVYAGIGT